MAHYIEAYIAPLPSFTSRLSEQGINLYSDLSFSIKITGIANIFFGAITSNLYIKVLRFTIAVGCLWLEDATFTECIQNREFTLHQTNLTKLAFSRYFLALANTFLCLAALYSFAFSGSLMYGAYAPYYFRKAYQNICVYHSLIALNQISIFRS